MQGYVPQAEYDALKVYCEKLEFQIAEFKRMIFGAKSERFVPEQESTQLSLFSAPLTEAEEQGPVKETKVESHTRISQSKAKPKRQVLPDWLERRVEVLEPDVDTSNLVKIGEEITERLEYQAAKLVVHQIIRPKYAPGPDKNSAEACTIHIAALPTHPILRCMAAVSLLAIIAIEKYLDHLPLYRQQGRYGRLGMDISRSTLCGWVAQTADVLAILYDKLVELVLLSRYIQGDETTIRVLEGKSKNQDGCSGKKKKNKTHQGYYWVFHDVTNKLLFFRYHHSREQGIPYKILQFFTGILQVDGYSAYQGMDKLFGLTLIHCWAHARRKFEKALGNDRQRAAYVLEKLQPVYALEERARKEQLSFEQRGRLRREKALPVIKALFEWLEEQINYVLPSSPIGEAIAYTLKRKKELMHYLEDGELEIDNNLVENAIRPVALGRKNYLFAGSHDAAQRAAIFYSLFACCRQHQVDPYQWLVDVLNRLPDHPVNRIEELLPHLWQPLNHN